MTRSFSTRMNIQAPADKVWRILTDLPRWSQWNTTVERTVGNIERGAKVTVFVKQSPERAFPLRVNAVESFAPFAALVIVAHVTGKTNATKALLAVSFFWLRLAH
jgi:hypothetical protein